MTVWREGVTGALVDTVVDMTLRMNNAGALPICLQLLDGKVSAWLMWCIAGPRDNAQGVARLDRLECPARKLVRPHGNVSGG